MSLMQGPEFQHILRILNTNVEGKRNIVFALTSIKGIGRRFGNIICKKAEIDINKRAGELTADEIEKLVAIIQNPRQFKIPLWFLNRQKDIKTGKYSQLFAQTMDAKLRDDIERLKKMRAHRGLRHWWGLRVRGQHTCSTGRRRHQMATQVKPSEIKEVITDEVFPPEPNYAKIAQGDELKLYKSLEWTMWELIEYEKDPQKQKQQSEADYSKLLRKVAWFDNIITFHQVWNHVPHCQLSNILYDGSHFKVFNENDSNYQVTAINMFKNGCLPQWEDPKNANGGEFRIEISNRDPSLLQKVWETLAQGLVTGNTPTTDKNITGVRIVQKSQWNSFKSFRVEMWVEDGNEKSEQNDKLKSYLEIAIIKEILQVPDTNYKEVGIKWSSHAGH